MLKCKVLAFTIEEDDDELTSRLEAMGVPVKPSEKEYYFRDGYINPYGISFITKATLEFRKRGAFSEINYNAGDSCLVDLTIEEVAQRVEAYWDAH